MGEPVVATAGDLRQVMGHGGRRLVGLPAGCFECHEGIASPDDGARLSLPLPIIVDRRGQVGLGVLGDGLQRLGVNREAVLSGQADHHAGAAWLWQEKQARCRGYSSAPAFTSKGKADRPTLATNRGSALSPGADGR